MLITKLKSKIHRATVTETNLNYEGSCAIDSALLEAANIQHYEQIQIYNINTGNRLTTYAIPAEPGSGIISVRGSAARTCCTGDLIIICTYAHYNEHADYNDPIAVYVDKLNRQIKPVLEVKYEL